MSWVLPVGLDVADGVTPLPQQPYQSGGNAVIIGTQLPTVDYQLWPAVTNGGSDIAEQPGSPTIERAEQCTCKHTVKIKTWRQAQIYWSQMPRGTVVQDTGANIWRVLSASVNPLPGGMGELSYVMESISFDTPPDDFQLNEVSLDLDIIKHPRYNWCLSPYDSDNRTPRVVGNLSVYYTDIKSTIIRMIQQYKESPFFPAASQVNGLVQSTIWNQLNPDANGNYSFDVQVKNPAYTAPASGTQPIAPVIYDGESDPAKLPNCEFFIVKVTGSQTNSSDPVVIALAAAKEILGKLWRQEDTPYIAGYEVVWTQYFFAPIYLNPGGYIEDPRLWVPAYFMDPLYNSQTIPRGKQSEPGDGGGPVGGIPGTNNNLDTLPAAGLNSSIFDEMTLINPQCFSATGELGGPLSMSCLRKADHYDYERTWFKVSHAWLCAPVGNWDKDLYNQNDRPTVSTDYNQLPADQSQL